MTKYKARPTMVNGIRFASQKEAARYGELILLNKAGLIGELIIQPEFKIVINGKDICIYMADFMYHDRDRNILVVEDVKGVRTPVYKLKKKLVEAAHGITITEV